MKKNCRCPNIGIRSVMRLFFVSNVEYSTVEKLRKFGAERGGEGRMHKLMGVKKKQGRRGEYGEEGED
jgi:hypothetical protein